MELRGGELLRGDEVPVAARRLVRDYLTEIWRAWDSLNSEETQR